MNELRQRAIRLLARREHSRAELARKLAAHGPAEEIDKVLTDLAQSGLQSDVRYVASYLRSQGGRLGVARLRQSLRTRGVDAALVEAQLASPANELPDELQRARTIWEKKFAQAPADAREWARQARFLQGRGFAVEVIRKLFKEFDA